MSKLEKRKLILTMTIPVVLLSMASVLIHSIDPKPISLQYDALFGNNVLKIVGMDFNVTQIQPPNGSDLIADYAITGSTRARYIRVVVGEDYTRGRWSIHSIGSQFSDEELPAAFNTLNVTRENVTITRLRYLGDWLPTLLYTENTSLVGSVLDYSLPTSHYTTNASVIGKVLYHDSQKVFSTSAQLPPYTQYWVMFAYADYDPESLRSASVVENSALRYVPPPLKEICAPIAEEATLGATGHYEKMAALRNYLSTRYELSLMGFRPCPTYADPIAWFLVDEPKGHSLHFNSALVMLARSIGIPARLVGGYIIPGNEGTGIVLPSQRRAYAEVEFEGLGWVSFDATPEPPITPAPVKVEPDRFVLPPILLGLLASVTIVVVFALLRSKGWKSRRSVVQKITPAGMRMVDERLLIEFPQIKQGMPAVYGVGEPLEIRVRVLIEVPPSSTLTLTVDDQGYPLPSLVDGCATTTVTDLSKGYHDVTALLETGPQHIRSSVRLKVVEYRDEVVELFNEMFRTRRDTDPRIGDALTAREFGAMLHGAYPNLSEVDVDRVASIFEFSDYSLRTITRLDYERFYLVKRGLEILLGDEGEHT